MDKKKILKKMYELREAISYTEKNVFGNEFLENGFVIFEKIRDKYYQLVDEFDIEREIEIIENIVDDGLETIDIGLLKEEDRKKYWKEIKRGNMIIKDGKLDVAMNDKEFQEYFYNPYEVKKEHPECVVKFKDIDEVIDYVLKDNEEFIKNEIKDIKEMVEDAKNGDIEFSNNI